MASFSDNAKKEAANKVVADAQATAAIYLKKSWNQIRLAGVGFGKQFKETPSDEEFLQMADDLIHKRSITLEGQTLTIDELDKVTDPEVKKNLGIKSFQELVPSPEQIGNISRAVSSAVGDNTGEIPILSALIPQLKGVSFGNFIQGLFKWIGGLFTGKSMSFTEAMAEATADSMGQATKDNLNSLKQSTAGKKDDVSKFLTGDAIENIGDSVRQSVMDRALDRPSETLTPLQKLKHTEIGSIGDDMRAQTQSIMKDQFAQQMLAGFMGSAEFADAFPEARQDDGQSLTQKAGGMLKGGYTAMLNVVGVKTGDQKKREAALLSVKEVSARLSEIIADPKYVYNGNAEHLQAVKGKALADMSAEDRSRVIAAEAKDVVAKLGQGASESDKAIYAGIELELPKQLATSIRERDASIPWFVSGKSDKPMVATLTTKEDEAYYAQPIAIIEKDVAGKVATLLMPQAEALGAMAHWSKPVQEKLEKDLLIAKAGYGNPEKAKAKFTIVLGKGQIDAIAASVAPDMVNFGRHPETLLSKGDHVYEHVSDTFYQALMANQKKINQNNIELDGTALKVLANRMSVDFVRERLGNNAPAMPAELAAKMQMREDNLMRTIIHNRVSMDADPGSLTMAGSIAEGIGYGLGWGDSVNASKVTDTISRTLLEVGKSADFHALPNLEAKQGLIRLKLASAFKANLEGYNITSADHADTMARRISASIGDDTFNKLKSLAAAKPFDDYTRAPQTIADGSTVAPTQVPQTVTNNAGKAGPS